MKRQKGSVITMLALMMPVFIGMMGLVIDAGAMFELKRRMQTAADFGALAAAHEAKRENDAGVMSAALYDVSQNGFEADSETDTFVTVNRPPTAGRFLDDSKFIEVIVEERAPLFFMSSVMEEGFLVRARAVASARPGLHCNYALNPTESGTFLISGTADVEFKGCGVQVNSTSSSAGRTNGGGTVIADAIDITGNYIGDGFSPEPSTGMPAMGDPLADLEPPTFSGCDYTRTRINADATLGPAVYCNGLDMSGPAVVTLNPGVYIVDGGGMTLNAGTTVRGTGVTFYITATAGNAYGPITINGGTVFDVSAPTSGPFAGILFFEDRELENTGVHKFNGGADMTMQGAIYTKNAEVKVAGTFDGTELEVMLVADKIDISGDPTFATLDESLVPRASLIPRIVE
jgi:hypothetical protein